MWLHQHYLLSASSWMFNTQTEPKAPLGKPDLAANIHGRLHLNVYGAFKILWAAC